MSIKSLTATVRRNFVKSAIVLTAVLVLPFVAFTGTARAAACGYDYLCAYRDINFGGPGFYHFSADPYICYGIVSQWNDQISSIDNHSRRSMMFYQNANCTGHYCYVASNAFNTNVHIGGCALGDQISSYYTYLN